jgi:hypothetical protein
MLQVALQDIMVVWCPCEQLFFPPAAGMHNYCIACAAVLALMNMYPYISLATLC